MKKLKTIVAVSSIIFSISLSACKSNTEEKKIETTTPTEETSGTYVCPMKCTEEKSDKPGKCSACGMDLEKENPS